MSNSNLRKEPKPRYIIKICLLGQGGVGKTCLCRRLCFNTFETNTKLTIGIDFYSYDLPLLINDDEEEKRSFVRLSIWDFGGQEQFKTFFPYYLGGANGIFLTFSLLDIPTLVGLDWWYDTLVQHNHENTPKIILGTKMDLINSSENKQRVDDLIINRFLRKHGEQDFIRTSSKSNHNIEFCFKALAKKVLDHNQFPYKRLL
ncbi:MAG: GTP-binding protein [Promethearchaeota archaeon]|nr:MAG: GTP-binding protein [Candidatus Lokiarchaeota archaeon]